MEIPEIDKQATKEVMAEFKGQVIQEECRSCLGYGHFKTDGKPSTDGGDRKCFDCGGTGTINRQY